MPDLTHVFHPAVPQTLARFSRRAGLPLTAAQAESLLAAMRKRFDGACGGSLEALADCRAEDLFCAAQEGGRP